MICILLACVFMPSAAGAREICFAADAVAAASYNGQEAEDLWYLGSEELDLAGMRLYVASTVLPVLEAYNAEPVVIAVIDTGLDLGNDIFDGMLMTDDKGIMAYNSYYDYQGDTDKLRDVTDETENKHGTEVASVIAILARELGLQNYIKIYPVKASFPKEAAESGGADTTTSSFNRETVRLGIENAVSEEVGADVINLSLCSTAKHAKDWADDKAMIASVAEASSKATIVAAAGNDGVSSDRTLYYPAAYENVLGVMASGRNGSHDSAGADKAGTNYGSAYDIYAPGEDVLVSPEDGKYVTAQGTSFAAPVVSFAAAVLKLALLAEDLAGGDAMPRNTVMTRLIAYKFEDDAEVTAPDGKGYKKLDILKLISSDIDHMDNAWLPVTGISVSATRGGEKVASCGEITVRTIRETGKGRSYLDFAVSMTPVGDVDPAQAADVVWELVEYAKSEEDDKKEEEVKKTEIGRGASVGYLFDRAGSFGVRASLTTGEGSSKQTFTAEFRTTVAWASWEGANAFIVPADYISSENYVYGTAGKVPGGEYELYGRGNAVKLTVTTIEDVDISEVNWYVNGVIAGKGEIFEFAPDGMPGKDYEITVQVILAGGEKPVLPGIFVVHHKSWAAHPLFSILWVGLGLGVIAAVVFGTLAVRKRRAGKAAANAGMQVDEAPSEDGGKESPIRKK